MRTRYIILGTLTLVTIALGSCGNREETPTKESAAIQLPDTRAGQKMSAYLDAINSGKTEALLQFITENFAQSALENFSANDRANACTAINKQTGHLALVTIEKSSEDEIALLTHAKSTKEWLSISIKLEANSPYRIIDEMICGRQAPLEINSKERLEVINNLITELNKSYIFAETAKKMGEDLLNRFKNGEYDTITDAHAFATKLTDDVRLISKDKHLRIDYSAKPLPIRETKERELTQAEKDKEILFDKRANFGFEKVERMDGNIGYIDLRGFHNAKSGQETVAAAMTFISNTDALIIDLRNNGGGEPAMVTLISSYLFGDKSVHLNDLHWRKTNKTESFWTNPNVPGKKFTDKNVFVLTSSRTFSGAEEFCYNLKNLKRATLIGQTTGGGAHPSNRQRLSEHFSASIPEGRAINPITKTNWEGTGVEPDIKVPKEQALKTAYIIALTKSLEITQDEHFKEAKKSFLERAKIELDEIKRKVKS